MDYEKKYKELHTFISDLYPFMSEYCKEKVEGFLPEIKESEDEKISKEIIKYLERTVPHHHRDEVLKSKEWIAWLEKQNSNVDNANKEYWRGYREGKQEVLDKYAELEKQGDSPIKWNKNTEGNKPQVNHSVLMKTIHGIAEGEWKGEYWEQYRWAGIVRNSDVLSWMELSDLDKQGEQKPTIEMKSAEESLGIDSETYNKIVDECIYGEQKFANKVEPKFKVGDWVVFDGETLHITNVTENGYSTEDGVIPFRCEKETKLWTIADAKGGDVLATEDNCMCIFDNTVEEGKYPFAYCGLSMYGFKVYDRTLPFTHDNVYPATKEQRDLLFQKMKEAGYEWSSENKELKKIEQKPDFCHHEVDFSDCSEEYRKAYYDGWNNCNQQHAQLKAEQKPAWSEEDENYLNTTIAYLKDANEFKKTAEKCISWLKSLKPQNRDTYNPYKEVVSSIAEMCDKYKSFSDDRANDFVNNVKVKCKDAKEYDSIYPQNTWKPNDVQMQALKEACDKHWEPDELDPLYTLYEQLKKLKE